MPPRRADLVVVNTCAFIEEARQESIDTILALADAKADEPGSSSPVAWPSATATSWRRRCPRSTRSPASACRSRWAASRGLDRAQSSAARLDLLNLPRPPASAPWAYVKIAEGCDRACGFCAIPSFRRSAAQSRSIDSILAEVDQLGPQEIVLVAQDLASYGKDRPAWAPRRSSRSSRRSPSGCRGCGCSTSTRPTSPTSSST